MSMRWIHSQGANACSEREELNRQMGDVGEDNNVVDEQMWDKDEEPTEQQKQEEKLEKNAPLSGGDKTDEMHTREDDIRHDSDRTAEQPEEKQTNTQDKEMENKSEDVW